jgi:hypothetical protein
LWEVKQEIMQQVLKMQYVSVEPKYMNEFLEVFSYMHLHLYTQTQVFKKVK